MTSQQEHAEFLLTRAVQIIIIIYILTSFRGLRDCAKHPPRQNMWCKYIGINLLYQKEVRRWAGNAFVVMNGLQAAHMQLHHPVIHKTLLALYNGEPTRAHTKCASSHWLEWLLYTRAILMKNQGELTHLYSLHPYWSILPSYPHDVWGLRNTFEMLHCIKNNINQVFKILTNQVEMKNCWRFSSLSSTVHRKKGVKIENFLKVNNNNMSINNIDIFLPLQEWKFTAVWYHLKNY